MAKAKNKDSGGEPRVKEKAMSPGADGGKVAVAGGSPPAGTEPDRPRPRINPLKFLQQVRQEVTKVTWPTRPETVVTTIMVFVMVIISAAFFALVDAGLGSLREYLLGLLG